MNKIDVIYVDIITKIHNEGFLYSDPNRTDVLRTQIPSYDVELTNGCTPVISLRKSYFKGAVGELLLFLQGHTDIRKFHEYGVKFWDKDVANRAKRLGVKEGDNEYYSIGRAYPYQYLKQSYIFDDFKSNRFRTDLIVDSWQVDDLKDMALKPCHFVYQLVATRDGFEIHWTQRSTDLLLGFPCNIQFYYLMGLIVEKWSGHKFMGVKGNLRNVHLYDNQLELSNKIRDCYFDNKDEIASSPEILIDDSTWDMNLPFSEFIQSVRPEHFKLVDYKPLITETVPMLAYDY